MKKLLAIVILGLVVSGKCVYVTERHPEPTTDSDSDTGDSTSSDSTGDGCTSGDGGEF